MLQQIHTATELITTIGLNSNPEFDFWVHMEFTFNASKTEVEVVAWRVSDATDNEISLNRVTYSQLEFIALAIAEEFDFHAKHFYAELESRYYQMRNLA